MINFIKNILPTSILFIAFIFDLMSKFIAKAGLHLHIKFNTPTGIKLKEVRNKSKELETILKNLQTPEDKYKKKEADKVMGRMNPKLYNIIKGNGNNDS